MRELQACSLQQKRPFSTSGPDRDIGLVVRPGATIAEGRFPQLDAASEQRQQSRCLQWVVVVRGGGGGGGGGGVWGVV